jgi:hypothetical protein
VSTAGTVAALFDESLSPVSKVESFESDDDPTLSHGDSGSGSGSGTPKQETLVSVGTIANLKLEAQRLAKTEKPNKKLRPQGAGLSATSAVIIQKAFRCVDDVLCPSLLCSGCLCSRCCCCCCC